MPDAPVPPEARCQTHPSPLYTARVQIAEAKEAPALKRELGPHDLTLFAITTIVSTRWIPAAAHAGPIAIPLWAGAAVFFAILARSHASYGE